MLSRKESLRWQHLVDLATVEKGSGFEVEVEWARFDTEDNTWEDLAKIWGAAPQFVKSELRKLRLKRGVRTKLKRQCGITLWVFCGFRMTLAKIVLECFYGIILLSA